MILALVKPSSEEITVTIERILDRLEFAGLRESEGFWGSELFENLSNAFSTVAESLGVPTVLIVVFGAVALLSLAFFLVHLGRRRRLRKSASQIDPDELTDPMRAAQEYADMQNYSAALVCLFVAHLHTLSDNGWIIRQKSKTNLQYEWELIQAGYPELDDFRRFRDLFHRVRYGDHPLDRDEYEQWLAYCTAAPPKGRDAA